MLRPHLSVALCLLLTASCTDTTDYGDYRCEKLVSSNRDTLYVKSYNWGLTGDSQISTISDGSEPIGFEDQQKPYIIRGLDPFLYRFERDTLTIYSTKPLRTLPIQGTSFVVCYMLIDGTQHMDLYPRTSAKPYYRVPNYDH